MVSQNEASLLPEIKNDAKNDDLLPVPVIDTKINKRLNAYKSRVKQRVQVFIEALEKANIELANEPTHHTLECAI